MARPKNKPKPSVAITPYNGRWVAFPAIGRKPNGDADRVKRSAKMCASCVTQPREGCVCWEVCADKVREVDASVAAKTKVQKGRSPTLGQFLDGWLADRKGDLEYKTHVSYTACVARLKPLVGGILMSELVDPSPLNAAFRTIAEKVSANEAAKCRRVLRSALSEYERLHPSAGNMGKLTRPITVVEKEVVPFTVEEVRRIFDAIAKRRTKARWFLALACGLRQGEALGLAWHRPSEPGLPPDVDLVGGTLTVREKQYRRTYEHGCVDPGACAGHSHEVKPWTHKPTCAPRCEAHASVCPQRVGGIVKGQPKNKKRRTVALPPEVVKALREHKERQDGERERAGSKWVESGLIFTDYLGNPVDSRRDWGDWTEILEEAGLAHKRVHDGRHANATFHKLLNIDRQVTMGQLGWSTATMADRYQHTDDPMARAAAQAMNDLLWGPVATQTDPDPDSATTAATITDLDRYRRRRKAG